MIGRFLSFLGENSYIQGFSSLCGIIGFVLTIVVAVRTAKINKILRYNEITSLYNKERLKFQNKFEGHRMSITEDQIHTKHLLTNILKDVEGYRVQFSEILSLREKRNLSMFIEELKKEPEQADYNLISNYLASISGRLSKKGDMKNA